MRKTSVLWLVVCVVAGLGCGPGDETLGDISSELGAPTQTARLPVESNGQLAPLPAKLDFLMAPGIRHLEERVVLRVATADPVVIRSISLRDDSAFRLKGARHFSVQAPGNRVVASGSPLEL